MTAYCTKISHLKYNIVVSHHHFRGIIINKFNQGQPRLKYLFQAVQTQTTTAYCRILPTLDNHVRDIIFRQFRHKQRQLIVEYYLHSTCTFLVSSSGSSDTNHDRFLYRIPPTLDHHVRDIIFRWFRHKQRQLIAEYYLHWTTTFEISSSGSSDTNHDSLL